MRLRVTVIEGDETTEVLVPLATVMAFPDAHEGRVLNDAIENGDFTDWEPWVAWHASTHRLGEERSFDDWVAAVDWVKITQAPDEVDPSGGETASTTPPSPASSSAPRAGGRSSSRSRTSSNGPSGKK